MPFKYVSIDTETTGLNPEKCLVLELAFVLEIPKYPKPLDELHTFHCYVDHPQITDGSDLLSCGEEYALDLNKEIIRRIRDKDQGYLYLKPEEVGPRLQEWLEKKTYDRRCDHASDNSGAVLVNPAGKNFYAFDKVFLNGLPNFSKYVQFSSRGLDPGVLYLDLDDFRIPSLKQCMERAGISGEVSHTAVDDACMVIELLRRKIC